MRTLKTGVNVCAALALLAPEKLELRMEARKSPVDIVVVDSAQQVPNEN